VDLSVVGEMREGSWGAERGVWGGGLGDHILGWGLDILGG